MKLEDLTIKDDEYIKQCKEGVQKNNAYFNELDPHGADVQYPYSVLPIRPYANIRCVKIAIINHGSSKIIVKYRDDIQCVRKSIVNAMVLMKFALTIESNPIEFLRNYQISYEPKLLKESTSWAIRYIESDYKFQIRTGAEIGEGDMKLKDVRNRVIPVWALLHNQICNLLNELKSKWPEVIYNDLISELRQIGLSNNSQHI